MTIYNFTAFGSSTSKCIVQEKLLIQCKEEHENPKFFLENCEKIIIELRNNLRSVRPIRKRIHVPPCIGNHIATKLSELTVFIVL